MSTTAVRPQADGPPAATFSYAQAAKGKATSSITSASVSSQVASGMNTPRESGSASITSSVSVNGASTSDAGEHASAGTEAPVNGEPKASTSNGSDAAPSASANPVSQPTSPAQATVTPAAAVKEDHTGAQSNAAPSAWDKQSDASAAEDRSPEPAEGKRGKKNRKGKKEDKDGEKEKEKEEEVKQEVLVAAPPPTVNVWKQRQQAFTAKAKPAQTPQATPPREAGADGSPNAMKASDTKRKVRDDGEKSSPVAKEVSANKPTKKSTDGNAKGKDDANKRAARGSRATEKDTNPSTSQVPPPVDDAFSWPTPETAKEEEKKKVQSRLERDETEDPNDAASNKPAEKKGWVKVPFVPTVTFQTPNVPTRGGRGRGGARGGRDSSGRGGSGMGYGSASGNGVEKGMGSTAPRGSPSDVRERGRENVTGDRATSLPPSMTKRGGIDNHQNAHESIKSTNAGKPKQSSGVSTKGEPVQSNDARRGSAAAQTALDSSDLQPMQVESGKASSKADLPGDSAAEAMYTRSGVSDRRSESNFQMSEHYRENGGFVKENGAYSQPRGESRQERGRGGYRNRGNHSNFPNGQAHNPHAFTNGHGALPQNGYPIRNAAPFSPSVPSPYAQSFGTGHPRGRGGSRSQSIPNGNGIYSRYAANAGAGPHQMAPLQTAGPMFDYQNTIQAMSAVPYTPFVDQSALLSMLTMQLEYYFSIDNLCKDLFLRRRMDSQGFVLLSFIGGFKRIKSLTDDINFLRYACLDSETIEIVKGDDGLDRVRRAEGWNQWVIPNLEEREPIARTSGPATYQRLQAMPMGHTMSSQQPMSPPTFSPNGPEAGYAVFPTGYQAPAPTNGVNGTAYHSETTLSAAVPDFAPAQPQNPVASYYNAETTFPDSEVEKLNLIYAKTGAAKDQGVQDKHSARTFSNGSIDANSLKNGMVSPGQPNHTEKYV